jgi:hypothetical protein
MTHPGCEEGHKGIVTLHGCEEGGKSMGGKHFLEGLLIKRTEVLFSTEFAPQGGQSSL